MPKSAVSFERGLALIELLVVVATIAILAARLLHAMSRAKQGRKSGIDIIER